MKATKRYFPVVLFIMLHKVVVTFESAQEISILTIQIKSVKAAERYFPVILFIKMNKVALTFESVNEMN